MIMSDWKGTQLDNRPEITRASFLEKHFIIRRIGGRRYVFVGALINLKNSDFKLILSKDIESVYQERVNDYQFFVFVSLGISILLAIGMLIISRSLTRPIVALSEVSKEIANGHYNKRVSSSGKRDEVGILEENFNKMVNVIEENIMELRYHNEGKQRFIDSLNHEIKTPITSIIGYSDLLLRSKVDEEMQRQALQYINSEAKRLALLNSTLLKLTLIREEFVKEEPVSMVECVQNTVNALSYKLKEQNIDLSTQVEDVMIFGDKEQFEVLLINLVDNARKASHEGGKINIIGEKSKEDNGYRLRIKDRGIGIAKEELDKILEPFYMVDKARTRKENGVGLGLAICNEICRNHKIALLIESELEEGTEVILKFGQRSIVHEK